MKPNEALARWNARFAGEEYCFGTDPNRFLAAQAHRLAPGQAALAVADGEGRNGVWLARQGLVVLAVDFSPVGLGKAKRLAERQGTALATECADLAAWNWGHERFDIVAGIFCQFAGANLRPLVFRRMRETVKPGGLVILQGYRPEQLRYATGGPKEIDHLYTEPMLRDAFAGFEMLHLDAHDDVLHEGGGHEGMSALIDMVARKPPT